MNHRKKLLATTAAVAVAATNPRTVPAEPVDPRAELLAEELHNHGGCEEVWPCCSVSTVEYYRNDARDLLARLDAVRSDA